MTIIESRFCQVYMCSDGVVISGNSAMATFLCDDPDAAFKCKLNGKRIRPCTYVLCLQLYLLGHDKHFYLISYAVAKASQLTLVSM